MSPITIIAMAGYAGTGKDTVADLLVEHAGFRKVAFADAVRGELANTFGVDLSAFTDRTLKEIVTPALALRHAPVHFIGALLYAKVLPDARSNAFTVAMEVPRSGRQIMQWWGSEYRRGGNPDYWVNALADRIRAYIRESGYKRFVIPDCRFDNEATYVRSRAGRIWQINRPGIDGGTTPEGEHVSATDGSQFAPDLVINNQHDIRHLQQIALAEFWSREAGIPGLGVQVPAGAAP